MNERITPKIGKKLKELEVLVFGSNLAGRHGAGSAKLALEYFGAKEGISFGLEGQSFAVPTKDKYIGTMHTYQIKPYVDQFILFAKTRPDLTFYVVEIGCMLGGHTPKDIAPLFKAAMEIENIYLPKSFWSILKLK